MAARRCAGLDRATRCRGVRRPLTDRVLSWWLRNARLASQAASRALASLTLVGEACFTPSVCAPPLRHPSPGSYSRPTGPGPLLQGVNSAALTCTFSSECLDAHTLELKGSPRMFGVPKSSLSRFDIPWGGSSAHLPQSLAPLPASPSLCLGSCNLEPLELPPYSPTLLLTRSNRD